MISIPDVVTHRYDPARGMCRNLSFLEDADATQILDGLRRESRPRLKPDYLARRRSTEKWLSEAASKALQRRLECSPVYFFLGDFSYLADPSRPAALLIPLSSLPSRSITFTLGDSMTVAEHPAQRIYTLVEMRSLFADADALADFGFSDKAGFQARFIEVQLWAPVPVCSNQMLPAHCGDSSPD